MRKIFLGKCRVPLTDVAAAGEHGTQFTLTLANESFIYDMENRGELTIHLKWIYDKTYDHNIQSSHNTTTNKNILSRVFTTNKNKNSNNNINNYDISSMISKNNETEMVITNKPINSGGVSLMDNTLENEENSKKRQEIIDANILLEKSLTQNDIKDGSYTIQVHIIECHDMKGANVSGLSDLIVYVEVLGQKQHTKVINEVSSCFFDETFYFNFNDLKSELFTSNNILISVYDSNTFRPNVLIGSYSIDLLEVYNNPYHEVYRQWVGVTNSKNSSSGGGTQGYLKYSCVCLAAGDKQVIKNLNNFYSINTLYLYDLI